MIASRFKPAMERQFRCRLEQRFSIYGLPTFFAPVFPSKQKRKSVIGMAFIEKRWLLPLSSSGPPETGSGSFLRTPKNSDELLDVSPTELHRFSHWWRSRFSRLAFNEFKLKASVVFDFATSTGSEGEPNTVGIDNAGLVNACFLSASAAGTRRAVHLKI
jgi:hypothetical protein